MKSPKLNIDLLEKLQDVESSVRGEYLTMYLEANAGGMIATTARPYLKELSMLNLIMVTTDWIVIRDYLSFNYGKLKDEYNPHARARTAINEAGFSYDYDAGELNVTNEVELDSIVELKAISNNNLSGKFNDRHHSNRESRLESIYEPQSKVSKMLNSTSMALVLVGLLLVIQTMSSSKAILNLTSLAYPLNYIYAIGGAGLLDMLLLYFVSRGDRFTTLVMFVFCSMVSVYSYHLNPELQYNTFSSYMAIAVSLVIPLMIHQVSMVIHNTK